MALDEESAALMRAVRASGAPRIHETTPVAARESMRARRPPRELLPDVRSVSERAIALAGGGRLPLRVITPPEPRPGVVLYAHGGGWVLGELDDFEGLARHLSLCTQRTVVMCGYRLAPEHPFPGPLDDVWESLDRVRELQGSELPSGPLMLAGDSAGGNLAAVTALRAARAGVPVAAQILVYPVTDYDLSRASYLDPENQLIVDRPGMARCWEHYVPDPRRRLDPEASPLRARIPAGVAPAIVVTAEHDVLRDEGELYVDALRAAGVEVRHSRFQGQLHGFLGNPALPGSAAALRFIGTSLAAIERSSAS
jgi:acetyl esterase